MDDENDDKSQYLAKRVSLAVKVKREEGILEELKTEYSERFGKNKAEIFDQRLSYGLIIVATTVALISIINV